MARPPHFLLIALLAVALLGGLVVADDAAAAGVRTQGKSAKHIRFLVRATPYKRCRVVVRRGKARRVVTVDVSPRGRRSRKIRMPDRGRTHYRVRCRDAHLFFASAATISNFALADPRELTVNISWPHNAILGLGASGRKLVWTQLAFIPIASGIYVADRDGTDQWQLYSSLSSISRGTGMNDGALVGNWYYWIEGGAIARADIATGIVDPAFIPLPPAGAETVAADGLTVDRDYIYFASCGNRAIGRVRHDGSELEKYFIPVGYCVRDVAVNGTSVYWPFLNPSAEPGAIGRASLDGGEIEPFWRITFGGGAYGNSGIAADDSHVYWTSHNLDTGASFIGRMNTDGRRVMPELIDEQWLAHRIAIAP